MDFTTDAFQDGLESLLAAAAWGAADAGEVLETAVRIHDGDPDSWLREWTAAGGAAWAAAKRDGSATAFLRAASYYAAALELIADTDGSVAEPALWERQRACWDRAVGRLGGERLAIPYAHTTLPGYFFRAADEPRPLVVIDHGGRHATSHAWAHGGAAAHARGYHWMTFDGPGRQAALFKQALVLRPDWEAVLTPVADAMAARPDVDAERMAVIGVEHGAYGIARALAFEHRFAAAIAEPGVVDVSTVWTDPLPELAREALFAGDRRAFDREIRLAGLFEPAANGVLRRRGRWYGLDGRSPFDLYSRVRRFRLGEEVERIATPLLVRERAGERFWPGQAKALYALLPGDKRFSTVDGMGDWLAGALG
jgi:prolyl oligopeptidase family protein